MSVGVAIKRAKRAILKSSWNSDDALPATLAISVKTYISSTPPIENANSSNYSLADDTSLLIIELYRGSRQKCFAKHRQTRPRTHLLCSRASDSLPICVRWGGHHGRQHIQWGWPTAHPQLRASLGTAWLPRAARLGAQLIALYSHPACAGNKWPH